MDRHLSLIKTDFAQHEKRTFPRFPFCYLTFKGSNGQNGRAFEVTDISHTGMQLRLREGTPQFEKGSSLSGMLHWLGEELTIEGITRWVKEERVGVEFQGTESFYQKLKDFLSTTSFAENLRPLHLSSFGLELPRNLKFWLRTDGPCEVFLWEHPDGEFKEFQVIIMENFIEWKDGEGLRTGRVLSKRDQDTPLVSEDEFVFFMDEQTSVDRVRLAQRLCQQIDESLIDDHALSFLLRKLGTV